MPIFDGVKARCIVTEEEFNGLKPRLRTWIEVYEDTGEIKAENDDGSGRWRADCNGKYKWFTIVHSAKFQTYDVKIKETFYEDLRTEKKHKKYCFWLSGSISSNFHGGKNWKDLSFDQLQIELDNIERGIGISLDRFKIENIEPSINPELSYEPFPFMERNFVSYRGNQPFNKYNPDSKGKIIGLHLQLKDGKEIKAYDKGKQHNLPNNIFQFELRYKRMHEVNDVGIRILSDLKDWNKVNAMLPLLQNAFDSVLIYDPSLKKNDSRLNCRQREMIERGRACQFWQDLKDECSNGTYYNRLEEFKKLSTEYGNNYHNEIRKAITEKWHDLMGNKPTCKNLPTVEMEDLEKNTSTVGSNNLQENIQLMQTNLTKQSTGMITGKRIFKNNKRKGKVNSSKTDQQRTREEEAYHYNAVCRMVWTIKNRKNIKFKNHRRTEILMFGR